MDLIHCGKLVYQDGKKKKRCQLLAALQMLLIRIHKIKGFLHLQAKSQMKMPVADLSVLPTNYL
jgi:hypothetical protein